MRRKAGSTGVIKTSFPSVKMVFTTEAHLCQQIFLPATTSSSINQERGSNGVTACTSEMVLFDSRNKVGKPRAFRA